ncbi:hypothetical protein PGB90_008671 [Kerria lacca]
MSGWKSTTMAIFIMIFGSLVKAHMHFIRLALLCILGLLGMYMLHKLAQDWNKIRGGGGGGGGGGGSRPQRLASVLGMAGTLFRISKRSVDSQVIDIPLDNIIKKFSIILYFDPIGCARKFVCYSASKSAANLTRNEFNLLQLLDKPDENENDAFKIFQEAAVLGRMSKNVTMCEKKYRTCYLSNKQLFTFYGYL